MIANHGLISQIQMNPVAALAATIHGNAVISNRWATHPMPATRKPDNNRF